MPKNKIITSEDDDVAIAAELCDDAMVSLLGTEIAAALDIC